jgi:hypothetical protein
MKKLSIYAVMFLSGFAAIAQSDSEYSFKSKNGHEVLPQSGEWSFGISATPFLDYAGRMLNGSAFNATPTIESAGAPTILNNSLGLGGATSFMGKYMLDGSTAIRIRFMGNAYSENRSNFVRKQELLPNDLLPEFVEDTRNIRSSAFMLGAGIEKRRGNNRLQGIYGGEVFIGSNRSMQTTKYGNDMTIDFATPVSTSNFQTGASTTLSSRQLEQDFGRMFFTGLRGYIGVEYFILPKLSIGAEIGYAFAVVRTGNGYILSETFDGANLEAVKVETKTKRERGLNTTGIGLDNTTAALNLFFYF